MMSSMAVALQVPLLAFSLVLLAVVESDASDQTRASLLRGAAKASLPVLGVERPIFELDLFVNDLNNGWQPTGFPEYLKSNATKYMNVAGVSFIQPGNLMDNSYVLPAEVANVVKTLRQQGVVVQLLVGGEKSQGWKDLAAAPEEAAKNAIALMKKYDCGIEVDNEEADVDTAGVTKFIKLCYVGRPKGTYVSMDVSGTPTVPQRAVIQGAIDSLDWVNLMVSVPGRDQEKSVTYGHQYGIPFAKMTVAYYAGWPGLADNCNKMDTTLKGAALFKKYGLKGLSIWSVGGTSYYGCKTDSAPGFSQAVTALGAHPLADNASSISASTSAPPSPVTLLSPSVIRDALPRLAPTPEPALSPGAAVSEKAYDKAYPANPVTTDGWIQASGSCFGHYFMDPEPEQPRGVIGCQYSAGTVWQPGDVCPQPNGTRTTCSDNMAKITKDDVDNLYTAAFNKKYWPTDQSYNYECGMCLEVRCDASRKSWSNDANCSTDGPTMKVKVVDKMMENQVQPGEDYLRNVDLNDNAFWRLIDSRSHSATKRWCVGSVPIEWRPVEC